jgi:cell division protein FtsB
MDRRVNQKNADDVKIDASQMTFVCQMGDFLRRNSTWFVIAALVLLVLQDIFGAHGVLAMRRSQKEAVEVQKEIQRLNEENQKLQNRVQSLKSDPATIERIAREEMGLARPGEYIFKIQPKPGESSMPLAQPAQPPKKP